MAEVPAEAYPALARRRAPHQSLVGRDGRDPVKAPGEVLRLQGKAVPRARPAAEGSLKPRSFAVACGRWRTLVRIRRGPGSAPRIEAWRKDGECPLHVPRAGLFACLLLDFPWEGTPPTLAMPPHWASTVPDTTGFLPRRGRWVPARK